MAPDPFEAIAEQLEQTLGSMLRINEATIVRVEVLESQVAELVELVADLGRRLTITHDASVGRDAELRADVDAFGAQVLRVHQETIKELTRRLPGGATA